MALFLGSQGSDAAALRATGEMVERLRQRIAIAQGMAEETEVAGFLAMLSAGFADEAVAEQEFQAALAGLLDDLKGADGAGVVTIVRAGRYLVAEHFRRRRSPLAVHAALKALDEAVLRRVFALAGAATDDDWCWLAAGWLGRSEVSFGSGLAGSYVGREPQVVAARVTPLLADCGYLVDARPICGGLGWYATLDHWQEAVAITVAAGDERCAGMADLRWVAGNADVAQAALTSARSGLARWRQSASFSEAARSGSNLRVALGFFGGLKVERFGAHRGAINIDGQALYPLVANVRFMAIAFDVVETDTAARLRELVRLGRLNVDPAGRVMEAYHHLQRWKLSAELGAESRNGLDRYIRPNELSESEQEALKECLDAVNGLERLVVQQLVGVG